MINKQKQNEYEKLYAYIYIILTNVLRMAIATDAGYSYIDSETAFDFFF